MGLRVGARDNSFPFLSHDAALAVIADLGLDGVDVSVSDNHHQLAPRDVLEHPDEVAVRVRATTERLGLAVADAFFLTGMNDTGALLPIDSRSDDARAAARAQFPAFIRFAVALGAPGITILPGTPWRDDRERGLAVAAAELQWRAEQAADAGLALSFEPHVQANVRTPAQVATLLEQAPAATVTLDLSHFAAQGIPDEDADQLIDRTRHVQFRQAHRGVIQATTADGAIDLARLLGKLTAAGYDGFVSGEYIVATFAPEVDTIHHTVLLRDAVRSDVR